MILIAEAISIVIRETSSLENETIDLRGSIGRVLAEDVFTDFPPVNHSRRLVFFRNFIKLQL